MELPCYRLIVDNVTTKSCQKHQLETRYVMASRTANVEALGG